MAIAGEKRRPVEVLTAAGDVSDSAVVCCKTGSFPLFVGRAEGGVDYLCSGCRQTFLAVNVRPGQIQDIVVECPDCKAQSRFRSLPPGEPIAIGRTVVGWPFRASTQESILIPDKWQVVISRAIAERFTHEVGLRFRWIIVRDIGQIHQVDTETGLSIGAAPPLPLAISIEKNSLEDALTRFRGLLGNHLVVRSEGSSRREGKLGTATRSRSIQRTERALVEATAAVSSGGGQIDPAAIADANLEITLLERWSHHPYVADVLTHLEVAPDYTHALATLGIATVMSEMGNGVALGKPTEGTERTADLSIAAGPTERLRVEVKAPEALDRPRGSLSTRGCIEIVKHAFRSAGVGPGGQLAPDLPGFLGIGCFGLTVSDLASIEIGARMYLERDHGPYHHIPGLMIANFALQVNGLRVDGPPGALRPGDSIATPIEVRTALNRTYDGQVPISTTPRADSPSKDFGPDSRQGPPLPFNDWPPRPARLDKPY